MENLLLQGHVDCDFYDTLCVFFFESIFRIIHVIYDVRVGLEFDGGSGLVESSSVFAIINIYIYMNVCMYVHIYIYVYVHRAYQLD